jgi:ligand-binding sensor domain-containing protein
MTVDNFNRIWFGSSSNLIMYKFSGEVLDPSSELWHKELIDSEFSSRKALNINVSPENKLWVLTNIGLIYKNLQADEKNPIKSTGPMINSTLRPYFPNVSFNFSSKIRFDPRGNIWVTSQTDGIHILKEDGNYWPDINGINTSNSNLLSNWVSDVTFNAEEGLAYIATNKGVSIIRIPFSEEKKSYNNVEIFPSPFRLPNDKPLTINGLMDNSEVKIMTLNGVVLRTISKEDIKGYQGFWDGRNKQGDYVGSGVYLLAFYNQEGASSIKKIAVIRK